MKSNPDLKRIKCRISELVVEVPDAGGVYTPLYLQYSDFSTDKPDIIIDETKFKREDYPVNMTEEMISYMESYSQFCRELIFFHGFTLHASAVEFDGKAYLFSGPCGIGKSTHTHLWEKTFGQEAKIFNDDKPAIRKIDGIWYAYGTPWCGKDLIQLNIKVPIAGVCFLKQDNLNVIRQLPKSEALAKLLEQSLHRFRNTERLDLMLGLVDAFIDEIPVFELANRPEPAAVILSRDSMKKIAEERGL